MARGVIDPGADHRLTRECIGSVGAGHNRTERQAAPNRARAGRAATQRTFHQVVAGPGSESG
jgi:hypothetical protein